MTLYYYCRIYKICDADDSVLTVSRLQGNNDPCSASQKKRLKNHEKLSLDS
jgi:hypothetical protein